MTKLRWKIDVDESGSSEANAAIAAFFYTQSWITAASTFGVVDEQGAVVQQNLREAINADPALARKMREFDAVARRYYVLSVPGDGAADVIGPVYTEADLYTAAAAVDTAEDTADRVRLYSAAVSPMAFDVQEIATQPGNRQ